LLLKKATTLSDNVVIKLKSGSHRLVPKRSMAAIGCVSNHKHFLRNYRKAGLKRLLGRRPRVRPSSMNPVDHPMGGRTRGGTPKIRSKTGKLSLHFSSAARAKTKHSLILVTARQSRKKRIS